MKTNNLFVKNVLPQIVAASIAVLLTFIIVIIDRNCERSSAKKLILDELALNQYAITSNIRKLSRIMEAINVAEGIQDDTSDVFYSGGLHINFPSEMYKYHIEEASKKLNTNELDNLFIIYSSIISVDSIINCLDKEYSYKLLKKLPDIERRKLHDEISVSVNCLKRINELIYFLLIGNPKDVREELEEDLKPIDR